MQSKKVSFSRGLPSTIDARYSLDHHNRITVTRIDTAAKLDHELCLTRHRSQDMQKSKADLFMLVSRTSKANLRGRRPKHDFSKVAQNNWSKIGREQVETGFA